MLPSLSFDFLLYSILLYSTEVLFSHCGSNPDVNVTLTWSLTALRCSATIKMHFTCFWSACRISECMAWCPVWEFRKPGPDLRLRFGCRWFSPVLPGLARSGWVCAGSSLKKYRHACPSNAVEQPRKFITLLRFLTMNIHYSWAGDSNMLG